MTPQALLCDLVALGDLPGASNARMAGYVQAHLTRLGVECTVLPGPEGDRVNLFATIGPRGVPGHILSGHMDVVPVEGQVWASDPFRLRAEGGRLYGRGTSDMKGYLACMLAMVPELQAMDLRRPIHLAFSYDEEIGCRGVGHMIARLPELCAPPLGCIVGEPSDLQPVLSHKGKQAVELRIEGRSAHSSQPDLGLNALYPALPPPEDRALADLLEQLTGKSALQSVSYGTEAGLFHAAGVPSIICGPGSMTRAHRPDEFVTVAELEACCVLLRGLACDAEG